MRGGDGMKRPRPAWLTTAELAHCTGLTLRQLQYLDEGGSMQPEHRTLGHRRCWSPTDALVLTVAAYWRNRGMSWYRLRPLLPAIRAQVKLYLIDGDRHVLVTNGKQIQRVAERKLLRTIVQQDRPVQAVSLEELGRNIPGLAI